MVSNYTLYTTTTTNITFSNSNSSTDYIWLNTSGTLITDPIEKMQQEFECLYNKFFKDKDFAADNETIKRVEREEALVDLMR